MSLTRCCGSVSPITAQCCSISDSMRSERAISSYHSSVVYSSALPSPVVFGVIMQRPAVDANSAGSRLWRAMLVKKPRVQSMSPPLGPAAMNLSLTP